MRIQNEFDISDRIERENRRIYTNLTYDSLNVLPIKNSTIFYFKYNSTGENIVTHPNWQPVTEPLILNVQLWVIQNLFNGENESIIRKTR